ncbi:substrate-binding domain-containing protein [Streptomyces sp. SID4941]|nr:substrate-binding domain-containing protein [Streptomyces sp. SID4941]
MSRATASRVVNGAPGASAAMRARVHAAVAELGWQPNESARALATGRRRAIDVIAMPSGAGIGWLGTHPYFSRVLAGMMPVLESADVQLRLHAMNREASVDTVEEITANATLGVLLADTTPEMAVRLYRRCRRVVSMVPTAAPVPGMEADNADGAYAAVKELYGLGRRRIAAVHGPADNPCATSRRLGYRRAVADLGLTAVEADGAFSREGGYAAVLRMLESDPRTDALFVACDLMAAGAVQAVTATGRSVPRDVSVIGFDDSIAAACSTPPLTTMRLPVEEMAAAAAGLLLDGSLVPGHRQHFPVELVIRQSTEHHGR